jgi:hypothetical protein
MVCHVCGRELSKSEAVPVYKNVLDREIGELKPVLIVTSANHATLS